MEYSFLSAASVTVFLCAVALVTQLSDAAETCTFLQGTTSVVAYCESDCCSTACCSSTKSGVSSSTTLILIIVGVVVALVIIALIIIAVVCCLKDRKKNKLVQNAMDAIELKESPTSSGSSKESSDRPRLYREKAMLVDKGQARPQSGSVNSSTKSKHSAQKKPDYKGESDFFQNEVKPSPSSSARTVSGSVNSRSSKSRQRTDSVLPQVIEVREPDDAEAEETV